MPDWSRHFLNESAANVPQIARRHSRAEIALDQVRKDCLNAVTDAAQIAAAIGIRILAGFAVAREQADAISVKRLAAVYGATCCNRTWLVATVHRDLWRVVRTLLDAEECSNGSRNG